MALTDKEVRTAQPRERDYKLFDGQGLFLLVAKTGGKRWRLKYRVNRKEKVLALGTYPTLSLKEARNMANGYRLEIAKGIDPAQERKAKKEALKHQEKVQRHTFKIVANAYMKQRSDLNSSYKTKLENAFKNDAYPFIGDKPITEIMPKDIIEAVKHVQERGAVESAHRLFTQIGRVFKYAVSNQIADRNPCNDMDKTMILESPPKRNYPTITEPKAIAALLNSIDDYTGDYTTKMALRLLPHVFVRPFNLRYMEWDEVDLKDRLWRIPKEKMKTKKDHIVPLTDTTVSILEDIQRLTGNGIYVFPGLRSKTAPMSDGTLNGALRRMGYTKEEIVPHGFRAMFSTIAHEKSDLSHEVIEAQLAHSVGSSVSQAYNRAIYLEERKKLMKWWSDYLDGLKKGSK